MKENYEIQHKEEFLTIGKVAKAVGILSSQVRYYTNLGLLKEAGRTQGDYRLYSKKETLQRLKKILQLKKQGHSLEEIKKMIAKTPEPVGIFKQYPVRFAYLFGSQAKKETTPLSDVDIAVFLDEDLTDKQQFDVRLELIGKLSKIYQVKKIDVVVLNNCSLLLSFNVVVAGELLYCIDEKRRIEFESKIMSLYFDQQYYYQRHAKSTIERIAREGIL